MVDVTAGQISPTPTPDASGEQGAGEAEQPLPRPSVGEISQGMTEDQARQLLQGLLDDSATLQEHLQQLSQDQSATGQRPGSAPVPDW
jgi:hypothetical protein